MDLGIGSHCYWWQWRFKKIPKYIFRDIHNKLFLPGIKTVSRYWWNVLFMEDLPLGNVAQRKINKWDYK